MSATKRSIFYPYSHLFQKLAPKALIHVYSTSEKSHLFVGPLNFMIQSLLGMLASRLLESTIFTQLTENIFELHEMSMPIQFFSCKNYFQWAVWMIYSLHFKIWPIDFYWESGPSGRLWFCSISSDSISTLTLELSKDLGLLPCPFESNTLISTFQYKRFHILWSIFNGTYLYYWH